MTKWHCWLPAFRDYMERFNIATLNHIELLILLCSTCWGTGTSQLQNALDDLDNALTDISPVKDAVGFSVLDRTLLRDDRGRMFQDEIARLKAEKERSCQEGQPASGYPDERPIGEVCSMRYTACDSNTPPPRPISHHRCARR